MFWTNWNDKNASIQKSTLTGSNITSIVTTNIRTPNGLAIDHHAQTLYWSDARLDKIEMIDFNGNNRKVGCFTNFIHANTLKCSYFFLKMLIGTIYKEGKKYII